MATKNNCCPKCGWDLILPNTCTHCWHAVGRSGDWEPIPEAEMKAPLSPMELMKKASAAFGTINRAVEAHVEAEEATRRQRPDIAFQPFLSSAEGDSPFLRELRDVYEARFMVILGELNSIRGDIRRLQESLGK